MFARSLGIARLPSRWPMGLATLLLIASAAVNSRLDAQPPSAIRMDALGDPLPQGALARLGTLRFKHEPGRFIPIKTAVFAPNGKYIASLSNDSSLRLWDVATGKEVPGPGGPSQQFSAVTFSPDGVRVVAASLRGTLNKDKDLHWEIIVFHIAHAEREQTIVYDSMVFNPKIPSFPREGVIQALRFTDGGKTLVAVRDNSVTWWDVATGKKQRTWTAFPNDKRTIDGQTQIKTLQHCVISADGKWLASQVGWKMETNGQLVPLRFEAIDYEAVGFDLASGKITWRTWGKGPPNDRNPLAFSGDSKRVAISMEPSTVKVRDAETGRLVVEPLHASFPGNIWYGGVALSTTGTRVALAIGNSSGVVWDLAAGTKPRPLQARRASFGNQSTQCLQFSPDDKTLLVTVDNDLQLYDAATLKEVQPDPGHRGIIDYLAFSGDGRQLFSGSVANELACRELSAWDVATWKQTRLTSQATPASPSIGIVSGDQSVYVGKAGGRALSLVRFG